ncbi:MAG: XRE family transcriptional regulator [Flavobacteriaceae bacterium]
MEKDISAFRFSALRKELGLTQSEFANELGISTTADIERGKTKISGKILVSLQVKYRINPLWLFDESDQMYIDQKPISILPKVVVVDKNDSENIVLVNTKAAAGYPQNLANPEFYDSLPVFDLPIPEYRNSSYRGFQIEGDSMLPSLHPGDWVLASAVERMDYVNPNRMYVVILDDAVLVKKIMQKPLSNNITLISTNESYPPYEIKAFNIQEIWEVKSKLTFNFEPMNSNNLLMDLQNSMEELKKQISSNQGTLNA